MLNFNFSNELATANLMDVIETTYQDILDFAINEDLQAEKDALMDMMVGRIRHGNRYANGEKKLKNGEVVGKKDFAFKTRDAKNADIRKKKHDKSARDQEKAESANGDIWYHLNIIPTKGGKVMVGKDIVEVMDKDLWHPRRKADRKVNLMNFDEDFAVTDSATETEKDPLHDEFVKWEADREVRELKAENAELKATVDFLSNQYNRIRKELLAIRGE